jgi:hypothetical protein
VRFFFLPHHVQETMRNRSRFMRAAAAAALLALASAPPVWAQVTAMITVDNAYRVGYGPATPASGPITWLNTIENTAPGSIFNCPGGAETYTNLNPGVADFIYVVAYGDDGGLNGFLGRFALAGGRTVVTGDPAWRVYATGIDVDLSQGGVTDAAANAALTAANPGSWQGVGTPGLALGEPNTAGGSFPAMNCGIPTTARWMWYASQAGVDAFTQNPSGGKGHKEFLVFRLPVRALMCSCPRVTDVETGTSLGVNRGLDVRADSLRRPDAEPPAPTVRPARPQD